MAFKRITSLSLFLSLFLPAISQSGPWMPSNADFSYPRTLMRSDEVDSVRLALMDPTFSYVYEKICGSVDAFMPNSALMTFDNWRRYHAHQAKNSAFVYLLDRMKYPGAPLDTLTSAQRDTFLNRSIRAIEIMNTNVESVPDWDPYLWRSNELTDNVIAYDLLKGAGVPDSLLTTARTKLEEYATNLHTQITANFFGFTFFGTKVNNHALRSAAAVALAGVVLNTADGASADADANAWVNTGLFNIDNVLWRSGLRQSEPGVIGGYSEGPHYLRFGMKHTWTLIHALGNVLPDTAMAIAFDGSTRNIRHPWHDENYVNLAIWASCILMPDGRMPSLEDSFVDFGNPETCQLERPELVRLMTYSNMDVYQTQSLNEDLQHSSDDIRAEFIASRTLPAPSKRRLLEVLPAAGDLVLRSSWDTTALYLHAIAKNGLTRSNAMGHNQADETSFILHAYGELMALDAGYLKYDRRDAVDEAENHNMILVDGAGPPGGSTLNAGGADAWVDYGYQLPGLQHGRVNSGYLSTEIYRHYWLVDGTYFLDADNIVSAGVHDFTWQCHGMGLEGGDSLHGSYVWDSVAQQATWKKNKVSLMAHTTMAEGTLAFTDQVSTHEFSYDSASTHTVLLATSSGRSQAHLLSALCPYVADTPRVETRVDLTGNNYLYIDRPSHEDALSASDEIPASGTTLAGNVVAPGSIFTFFSAEKGGQWSKWHVQEGDLLRYGSDTLMQSTVARVIALQRVDSANYSGYVGGAATVTLAVEFSPGSVNGFTVSSWTYDPVQGTVTIVFSGADEFYIHKDLVTSNSAVASSPSLAAWPNPTTGIVEVNAPGEGSFALVDFQGRVIRTWEAMPASTSLSVEGIPQGMYVLQWWSGNGRRLAVKLLKQD